jgi:putative endonuclease
MVFHYVYVLESQRDHHWYIGYTMNVKNRLRAHQAGQNTSTSNRRPFILIFLEGFQNETDARRREAYFKTTKGKTTLKLMLRDYLKCKNSYKP